MKAFSKFILMLLFVALMPNVQGASAQISVPQAEQGVLVSFESWTFEHKTRRGVSFTVLKGEFLNPRLSKSAVQKEHEEWASWSLISPELVSTQLEDEEGFGCYIYKGFDRLTSTGRDAFFFHCYVDEFEILVVGVDVSINPTIDLVNSIINDLEPETPKQFKLVDHEYDGPN